LKRHRSTKNKDQTPNPCDVHYIQSVRAFLLVDDLRGRSSPQTGLARGELRPSDPSEPPTVDSRGDRAYWRMLHWKTRTLFCKISTRHKAERRRGVPGGFRGRNTKLSHLGGVPGTQYQTLPPQPAHARRIRWIRGRVFVLGVRQCMSSGGTEEVDTRLERNRHQVEILRECLSSIQLGVIRQRSPAERSAASSRTRFSRQSRDRILKRKARNCQNDLEMVSSPKASGSGQHGSRHRIQRWSRRRKGRLLG